MTSCRALTPEEVRALFAFAQAKGRTWKAELRDAYWFNARLWTGPKGNDERVGSILHGLRNDGRFNLDLVTFAKLEWMAGELDRQDAAAPKGWDKAETSTEDDEGDDYEQPTMCELFESRN